MVSGRRRLIIPVLVLAGACGRLERPTPIAYPNTHIGIVEAASPADESAAARAIRWTEGPPLPQGRDHHAVFSARAGGADYLYVAGGTDYSRAFMDAWRLRVTPAGPAGAWERMRDLPAAVMGHSVAAAPGLLVLTGGQIAGGRRIADVYTARLMQDGTIGGWQQGPPLPRPTFHHPALYHDGWIYVVGGQGERMSESSVFASRVGADGLLSEWVELTPLPRPRSHHAGFIQDGAIYVVGGADGNAVLGNALYLDVWRAPLEAPDRLGEWRRVSIMPQAYGTHAAFVHDGFAYSLGGVENDQTFTDFVLRAPFPFAGLVGEWQRVADPLPVAKAHVHNTPVLHGRIYSAGGSNNRRTSAALHIGTFEP
jgi:hypothetical protein